MQLLFHPNPILRQKSLYVDNINNQLPNKTYEVIELSKQLEIFCKQHNALGLAAPQVGELMRIIIINIDLLDNIFGTKYKNLKYPNILFNPSINNAKGHVIYKEGCLSVPNVYENTIRFEKFTLNYQDQYGIFNNLNIQCNKSDPYGIVIQHEIDHLNGILFVDQINI